MERFRKAEAQENDLVWRCRFESPQPRGRYIKSQAWMALPRQRDLFHMTALQLFVVDSHVIQIIQFSRLDNPRCQNFL